VSATAHRPPGPATDHAHRRRLRVRTGRRYPIDFTIDLGQRNAAIIRRPLTPFVRIGRWGDAVTFLPERRPDVIHSFNAVPLTSKPYLVTFEDYLPRTPEDRRIAWLEHVLQRLLVRRQCVRLLPISEYALRQFRWQNRQFRRLPELEAKTEVLYPGVHLRRQSPKAFQGTLRLVFVGNDFMRKGLPALARAHAKLRRRGVPIETTVVSTLRWSSQDYIGPPDERIVDQEKRRLDQDGLTYVPGLPNARALELMDRATFLVLPTLHDTFGYVALEAMAGGTPVIATATCAIPEVIADGVSGYLLRLENEPCIGKWAWTYRTDDSQYEAAYLETIEGLALQLADRVAAFWERPGEYERLSSGALDCVRSRFGIERARRRLESLYEDCRQVGDDVC
jgi:glycosyltransferase involved in cell wall biosynthesis